jgi:hypothetical protein
MRGGKRNGAGRKKGAKTQRTRKTKTVGIMPLDVMLEAMRQSYEDGETAAAAAYAKDAAPYCHPKLAAITHKGDAEHPMSIQEVGIKDKQKVLHPDPNA